MSRLFTHWIIIFFIFILIAYPTSLSAQSIRFTRFMNINEGEPMGGPDSIVQDDLGYLWIATWGQRLFRYDGQTYQEYVSILDDSSTISASNVKDILVGQNGIIWFATSNGVSRFNSDNNNFTRYKMPNEERSQLIIDIYEDHDGKIWVCNVNGEVFTYDKESDVYLSYTLPANQFFEEDPPVVKVFQDSSRDYWFVLDQNGVLRYSPVDNHFYRYGESPWTEGDLSDYDIRLIYEDRKNTLWFGTINGGLNRYDRENDNFVSYPFNQNNSSGTSHRNIWNIYEDTHGNFWIATTSGLNLMNRKNETFQYYYAGDNPESLSEDWIVSICEDKGGNIWFGTGYSGLNMFNPKTLDFEHLEPGLFVWSVYEDKDQMLWIGTEKEGLHRRDLVTGEKTVFYHDPDDDSTISNNSVYYIFEDSQNNIWVGTSFGLNKFDRNTGQFTRYYNDDSDDTSISDQKILIIDEDSSGTVWIGTGNGLAKYNRDSDNFASYFHDPADETSLSSNTIYSILDDSNGNLWVGTWEGLNRMALGSKSFIQYKSQKNGGPLIGDGVLDVYEGSDGSIYVSAGGFHKWIPEADTFISISKEDGLPDNSCSQIFEDNSGDLWVSTFMGIVKVSPDLVVLETYTYKDGLQANDFNSAAGWKNEEGFIYFAGFNGISRFLPENITPSTYSPPVVLTSLRIFDEEVLSGPWISTKKSIDVAWDENFFSFEFAAFDYRDSKAIEYAYKLEGYDEDWKYPVKRNYAGYTNIPGGKYTFLVKATNSDSVWTTEENYASLIVNIATHPLKHGGQSAAIFYSDLLLLQGSSCAIDRCSIWLKSKEGKGSSFIFTLPVSSKTITTGELKTVASVREFHDVLTESSETTVDSSTHSGDLPLILFVDDEAINQHVMEQELKNSQYSLATASDGEEALRQIMENQTPNLVLLDIMMPGMDGYEVCKKIREKFSANDLPVIMVTAKNQVTDLVEGLSAGANDFISKPYSKEELLARIRKHMDIAKTHTAFGRFVPKDLLRLLGKGSPENLESGDHIEKQMTLLLTDFTGDPLIKKTETLTFLSSFLPQVLPVIREHHGIIHRYEGEGVMSFFPGSSADALESSIKIQKLAAGYNTEHRLR